jgi:hypothetical protein
MRTAWKWVNRKNSLPNSARVVVLAWGTVQLAAFGYAMALLVGVVSR